MKRSSASGQLSALQSSTGKQNVRQIGPLNAPKDEIWMRHKVCDSLKHASRFKHKGWESDFVKVHAHSNASSLVRLDQSYKGGEAHAPKLRNQRRNNRSFLLVPGFVIVVVSTEHNHVQILEYKKGKK